MEVFLQNSVVGFSASQRMEEGSGDKQKQEEVPLVGGDKETGEDKERDLYFRLCKIKDRLLPALSLLLSVFFVCIPTVDNR